MMLPTNVRKRVSRDELKEMLQSRSRPHDILNISNIIYSETFNDTVLNDIKLEYVEFNNCMFENVRFAYSTFIRTNFISCEMTDSNFQCSIFQGCNIEHCTLKCSNFTESNFNCVDVEYTDMSLSNFQKSHFEYVTFHNCNLEGSNFNFIKMSKTEFENSNLNKSSFKNTIFNDYISIFKCDVHSTDFSRSTGLLNPIDDLSENFEWNSDGMIVYKIFDHYMPSVWPHLKKPGDILTEEPNYDRTLACGCGINVGNREWFLKQKKEESFDRVPDFCQDFWECLIKFRWLSGVIVPYKHYGQIRCSRIQLIKKFSQSDLYNFYEGE